MSIQVTIIGPFYAEQKEGGVENHVHYLSENLEKHGVEVERLSWKINADSDSIKKVNLLQLDRFLKEDESDIVHFHTTSILFSWLCNFQKKKFTSTIHGFFHPENETTFKNLMMSYSLSLPFNEALKRIKNNIAISALIRREAESRSIPIKEVIGNGVPVEMMERIQPEDSLQSDVIMVGRFAAQKGVYDFIKAFSNSKLRPVLAGYWDPGVERQIEGMCQKGNIKCMIRPDRQTLLRAIKSSKVLAFPSKYEPFGIVGLEALSLGKPVVVYSDSGGPLDYIVDGQNGLVIENNSEALRKNVIKVLEDDALLSGMSQRALVSAKGFDWSEIALKTKKFYERLLTD